MPDAASQPGQQKASPFIARGVRAFIVAFVCAAVSVIATYPAVTHLSDRLIGHPDIDVWNHVWGFWWVKKTLLDQGRLPLFTDMIGYPKGGRLYFIDPLNALISAPLQSLVGLVPAYNLVLIGELAFTGVATYWLARATGASWKGSLFAGVLVCSSPVLRCELHNGITEVGNAGWLVLAMLAAHRATVSGRFRDAVLAGAATALAFIACWYHGMAAGGVAIVLALVALVRRRGAPGAWRRAVVPAIGYVAAAALLAAPFWGAFLWTLQGDGSIIKRLPGLNDFLVYHNATDVLSFFMPGQYHSPDLWKDYGERFLHTTYLGYTALLAAGFAYRRVEARVWFLVGTAFGVLTLGPYLFVDGAFVTVGNYLVPLPFAILSHGIGLMAITHPARMVIVTIVCLAVVAALGLDRLVARFPAARVALPVAFIGTGLVELILLSPAPFPMSTASASVGPGLRAMADDPVPGAVLDVPVQYLNTMRTSRYLYEQTVHHRPTPYVVNVRAQSTPWLHQAYIYQWIRALPGTTDLSSLDDLKAAPLSKLQDSLQHDFIDAGYRYIVIHRDIISPPFGVWPYRHLFDPLLGPPMATRDGLWIYRLSPPNSRAPASPRPESGGP